ncbi:DUF4251 domain-containing protein [uncultured Croceitalea sp.]|uniref:DUF4251 domain-containing protein n=1 Tax=uncultured Croceitalea sp. TaxID=1798908 RepID=UPI00374E895C
MNKKVILSLLSVLVFGVLSSQSRLERRNIKEEEQQMEYLHTKQVVESGSFEFKVSSVNPFGGQSKHVKGDGYFLNISPDGMSCSLPYFGIVRMGGYGENGGISFEGNTEDYHLDYNDSLQRIIIEISSKNRGEKLDFVIVVFGNGRSSINVSSTRRNSITYWVKLTEINKNVSI